MTLAPTERLPLEKPERQRLEELERVVERGLQTFVEVGNALMEIRDARLYRETHGSFEAYLNQRWGMSRAARLPAHRRRRRVNRG